LCEEFGHKLLPLLVSIDYNNLIKIIKRNANFEKFKTRILIALNIKKERTKGVAFDEFNEIISRF
ncbi:TPA: hypothetical protein ACPYBS_002282, partial [Streptococcus pneumoniae]|nr:hypothetical protein [Streptococcus pneumoniae]HEU3510342.1 hypothetical protein [Streptococcus pneumoniae]HEU3851299.1 hypothetical protein [Streptococcus pneumoniae]HEU6132158.1 hypothetical protein [Streptococcus pneumoniae]HEV4556534.1 hypothetical protein [Streptococcus pneumoniae]